VARNIWIGINMPAPLVGVAIGAAARLAAKKLAGKAAKKVTGKAVKKAAAAKKQAAVREETKRIAKNSVKVRPASKPKPNKPNEAKILYKVRDSGGRAYNKALKEYDSMPEAGRFGSAAERQAMAIEAMSKAPVGRKTSIAASKLGGSKPVNKTAAIKKTLKKLKPMEDVPKGVSARFAETNARMAREAAKKKK
jgi:hypothetical protein